MLNVSTAYLTAVDNYIRDILTRVKFNGSTVLTTEIMSATVSEIGQSKDSITIGDLCTNSATVKFTMPTTTIPLENGYFQLEHGVLVGSEYVWIPMGTFYISEIETTEGSNKYTVKGFDRSTRLEKDYVPTVTLPTTVEKVVKDICTQCNITLATYTFPNITVETIYEGTCKDTLKYMAGLMGKNAKIDRNDKLTFYWYGSSVRTIGQDIQFMGGFVKTTEEDIVIHSLTSGSEENTLTSGNGRGISFENPYMTQSLLDGILAKVNGFTYTPAKIIYKGNPALEIGDVVSVEDRNGSLHNCIICEQEFVLTGMKSTIQSKGGTEQETVMKQESPTEKKLKKMYNVMQNAFKESTDKIIGAKGGHYVIDYDSNGYPTGWRIMDTPTVTDNTKMWIFNKNGLGFSADGGKTIKNFAFDLDGNLNANVVTTGALQGEYFELDLDNGTLVMGERGTDGEFTNKWLEVNQNGLSFGSSTEVKDAIKSIEILYALGSSTTVAPTSGWVYPAPQWQDGKYMWQKTITTRNNNETEEKVTCISGATGQSAVNLVIESSNGFTISEKITSTVLTARIYEGSTEKDSVGNMTYTWYISTDGVTYSRLGTGKSITVNSSQIVDNTKVYFEAV
ncbi:hypothetical protein [Methanobrevibacter sp.]|uniref:hypothetical protein n=1 Tax=Methanobrevibacter sp. TaxID=66852 RepID=UPI003890E862